MRARSFLVLVMVGWALGCGGDDDSSGGGGGAGGSGAGGSGAMMCGNGVREATEQCDSNDLGMSTCMSLGKPPGVLRCKPTTCIYDTFMCSMTMTPSVVAGTGG